MKRTICFAYVLVLFLVGCAATGSGDTQPTASSSPTQPPATPTPPPTYTPQKPLYGGDVRDFVAAYGHPSATDTSNSITKDTFALPGHSQLAILLDHGHVDFLQVTPPDGTTWTETQAKDHCDGYIPPDRTFRRFYTLQNPLELVWEWQSDTVKHHLAADLLGAHDGTFYEGFMVSDKHITVCSFSLE